MESSVMGFAGLACLVSLVLTGLTITLSRRLHLLDKPEARKVHQQPTPRLGGVGIVVAALVVGALAFWWLADTSTPAGRAEARHYLAVAVGAVCVFVVGVIDDLCGVSSKLKLLTLLAASCVLSASEGGFNTVSTDALVIGSLPTWLSWTLTAVWITGMAVAFNFIDGLDGLAGGLALMACAVLGFLQIQDNNPVAAIPPLVVAGSIAGFLYHNRPPAKTFMGDGGSLTLGYLIGALTISANSDPQLGTMRAVVVPSLAMSVAIVDAALTMFRRRYLQRRSMFTAERGHIHHRLLDRGLKPTQAVLVIHVVSFLAVAIGYFSLGFDGWSTLGGLALVVPLLWGLFHAAGSVRTSEMVTAVRQKRAIDKTSRRYRAAFETLQLEFDGARSFSHWWQTVCNAAEQLHFSQVELPIEATPGEKRTFRWVNTTDDFQAGCQRIDAKIPVPLFGVVGETANADIRVPIVATLESAGERLALFSRLMAENGYKALRRINRQQAATVAASDTPIDEPAPGEFGRLRVAIVHDFFYTYAGAERVVEQLINIFPHCDVFGLFDFMPEEERGFLKGKKVHTTFLQRLPFARRKHRAYLPLMPLAIEQLDVSSYDLVVSSSYLAAKGVITGPDQLHVCYCHSPARYAWDLQHQYLADAGLGFGLKGMLARAVLHYLRNWDARSSLGVDHFIANSRFVAGRIKKLYRREAEVIPPPVRTDAFVPDDGSLREDYYVVVGSFDTGSSLELTIDAFNRSPDRRLVVLGSKSDARRLRSLAGSNVTLHDHQELSASVRVLQRAKALIDADGADFPYAAVEAMACGTPIVAFRNGGVKDFALGPARGEFFYRPDADSLLEALARFEAVESIDDLGSKALRQVAERFSVEEFRERLTDYVRKLTFAKSGSLRPSESGSDAPDKESSPDRTGTFVEPAGVGESF